MQKRKYPLQHERLKNTAENDKSMEEEQRFKVYGCCVTDTTDGSCVTAINTDKAEYICAALNNHARTMKIINKDRQKRREYSTYMCCLSNVEDGEWSSAWEDEEDAYTHEFAARSYAERLAEDVENWDNIYVRVWNTDKETVKEAKVIKVELERSWEASC